MQPPENGELVRQLCVSATELAKSTARPLQRLTVRAGDVAVELEWAGEQHAVAVHEEIEDPSDHWYLRAPMVGTFYHAPSPDSAPFVAAGDVIDAGQPVGILEAMKLMNPVECDRAGRIVEIVVPDGSFVEYDQPLVLLAPAEA